MSHGKAKLTPAGRLLLVDRIERQGWAACHAAAMAGVSRATAYKWLARWRAEGESRSSCLCKRAGFGWSEVRVDAVGVGEHELFESLLPVRGDLPFDEAT